MKISLPLLLTSVALLALSACGGSGGPAPALNEPPPVVTPPVEPPVVPPVVPPTKPPETMLSLWFKCEHPRTGRDPNNLPYMDKQGTLADELEWLRLWLDESYLWYKELPQLRQSDFKDPVSYFAAMKTPAVAPNGKPKDKFHFSYPSERWDAMSKGEDFGYGISWVRSASGVLPRVWRVAYVQPGSPAALAGVKRGDRIAAVDAWDFANTSNQAELDLVNAALSPKTEGETHVFGLVRNGTTIAFRLKAAALALDAVQNARVIDTAQGKVGYLTFNTHNLTAEGQLVKAFKSFRDAGVSELVLDVRYNGGGLLLVASELAYMIAGPGPTAGKVFEQILRNDKTKRDDPILFRTRSAGLVGPDKVPGNEPLPYLGLKRVTLLTGPGTCSASESVINSLRGVDVQVDLIGGTTCGKPYGFSPSPNCGTTYFAIQFQGVNHKGFGDYGDGFAPTCVAADDLSHELGDSQEGLLATALQHRAGGSCPVSPALMRRAEAGGQQQLVPARPEVSELKILP